MVRYSLIFSLVVLLSWCGFAQDETVKNFVGRFKEIAIEEMHRTGIPASIKLAQAIIESDAGRSDLAVESNNCFGMKCGVEWQGPTVYKKDDDYDRRGRLIPSCFRAYHTPEESFIAHSEFLLDPRKAYRYGQLFSIDRRDYRSWAWGLKDAGYATNPRYANLLISVIERYELYTYDYFEPISLLAAVAQPVTAKREEDRKERVTSPEGLESRRQFMAVPRDEKVPADRFVDGIITNNGVRMVYARLGDTPSSLAERYGVSLKAIIQSNEGIATADQPLDLAERVYLDKKKKSYRGSIRSLQVAEGQSMYEIAQIFGIQLERLYIRNRMFPGAEALDGERIVLKGMVKNREKAALRYVPVAYEDAYARVITKPQSADRSAAFYTVSQGDTLYAIAAGSGLTVDELKRMNSLTSDTIRPGDVLRLR